MPKAKRILKGKATRVRVVIHYTPPDDLGFVSPCGSTDSRDVVTDILSRVTCPGCLKAAKKRQSKRVK